MIVIIGAAAGIMSSGWLADVNTDHPPSRRIQEALHNRYTARFYRDLIPEETTLRTNSDTPQAPNIKIGRYNVVTDLPTIPEVLFLYQFKTAFSNEDINTLARRLLGVSAQSQQTDNEFITYAGSFGYMTFNRKTGAYIVNTLGLRVPFMMINNNDMRPLLTTYLKDTLGIIDDTVTLTAFYKNRTTPGITYFEFHRDPEKVGLPIINPIGTINIDDSTKIQNIGLTRFSTEELSDEDIISASDNMPGKARREDFNTLTVALSEDGSIISIISNIRPLEETDALADLNLTLLEPKKAIEELPKNGAYFDITIPAGQGYADLDKVYVNNKLDVQEATITDVALVFIEKPPHVPQKYLQPAYVIRGYAETKTGFRVKFAQTVPALNTEKPLFTFWPGQIFAQEVVQQNSSRTHPINIPCGDGIPQVCTFELFKEIPTPALPTIRPTLLPTAIVAQSTLVPTASKIAATATPEPAAEEAPICNLKNTLGSSVENGQHMFVAGIGTIFYFPNNLASGPLAIQTDINYPLEQQHIALLEDLMDAHLTTLTARQIIAKPKINFILHAPAQNASDISLTALFPGVSINLSDQEEATQTVRDHIFQAINHTGPSLQALASGQTIVDFTQNNIAAPNQWYVRRSIHELAQVRKNHVNSLQLSQNCRFLTTISPLLYFYPDYDQNIRLTFDHNHVIYSDPVLSRSLNFYSNQQGELLFDKDIVRDKIHYEYSNVTFERPHQGWYVKSDEISSFINNFGGRFGLNTKEIENLRQEVEAGLITQKSHDAPYLFVSILNEKEVNEKLPLSVYPRPETFRRLHVYIETVDDHTDMATLQNSLRKPFIDFIERKGFTVIETGAYVK